MALKLKVEKKKEELISENKIEEIISKGGSVVCEKVRDRELKFSLRLPASLMEKIDEDINKDLVKLSRNQWILLAIEKMLKREC